MTVLSAKTAIWPVNKVKLNPNNPRTIKDAKFKKLKKSITDFPRMLELRPIVVDENCIILGGNMRYTAIKDLGWKEVTVTQILDLTEEQKKEFIVKDNQEYGDWDFDALANMFEVGDLINWGFEPQELGIKMDDPAFAAADEASGEKFNAETDEYDDANIKMVNLFFSKEAHEEFTRMVDFLRQAHGTDNITDTVYKAIKYAYNNSEAKV